MQHQTQSDIYFDYRCFFYALISLNRTSKGYNQGLYFADPITKVEIDNETFELAINRYGLTREQFMRLWGDEVKEKDAMLETMQQEEAQRKGRTFLTQEERAEFLRRYDATEPEAIRRVSFNRVIRFLTHIQNDSYASQLFPLQDFVPKEVFLALGQS